VGRLSPCECCTLPHFAQTEKPQTVHRPRGLATAPQCMHMLSLSAKRSLTRRPPVHPKPSGDAPADMRPYASVRPTALATGSNSFMSERSPAMSSC
jgi:hypothetical protein